MKVVVRLKEEAPNPIAREIKEDKKGEEPVKGGLIVGGGILFSVFTVQYRQFFFSFFFRLQRFTSIVLENILYSSNN